jgi:DNA-binding PadR family transcriptional regulator
VRGLPVTTYAVLGQLAGGPGSGYEIKARLETGAAQFWHASYSQIYAELRRLTDLGLVSEEHVLQDARPNKRVYTITPDGRRALRAWLEEPWGLANLRDESLVKLTLADPLPPGEVVEHLQRLKAAHERRRAEFEAEIAERPEGASPYLVLALRKGVHAQRAFAKWCQEAIDALDPGG